MQESRGKINVVGIGPGDIDNITYSVINVIKESDVIIGYNHYFQFIEEFIPQHAECINTGMKQEIERAKLAFELAEKGKNICVISSGDSGIYGMAPLIYEMKEKLGSEININVFPGISAFQKAASLLGAPIGHDFCIISLSDLLTPWGKIEKRIEAAAKADFITAIYNPKSNGRYWQLHRLKDLFLENQDENTPVGYIKNAGREGEQITITTLGAFDPEQIDMLTIVIIGNSSTFISKDNKLITPRGYYNKYEVEEIKLGQKIMMESFGKITKELKNPDIDLDKKWALLHAIHTTADFEMEDILFTTKDAVSELYKMVKEGQIDTIITDVTMVKSGIRKGAIARLGIDVKCYLDSPQAIELAAKTGITRTQAGIRIAAQEHPNALYVFGNAPTAVMELCTLIKRGKASPAGMVVSPVGFVNVQESKHMAKTFKDVPKIIVEGRKGGSNIAATIVNSILTYDDAQLMRPGKDL